MNTFFLIFLVSLGEHAVLCFWYDIWIWLGQRQFQWYIRRTYIDISNSKSKSAGCFNLIIFLYQRFRIKKNRSLPKDYLKSYKSLLKQIDVHMTYAKEITHINCPIKFVSWIHQIVCITHLHNKELPIIVHIIYLLWCISCKSA